MSKPVKFLVVVVVVAVVAVSAWYGFLHAYYRSQLARLFYTRNLNITQQFTQVYAESRAWELATFLGAKSEQTPTDNWTMQEIIYDVKPDFVVETGTAEGGTALYYAGLLALMESDGKVITVDLERKTAEAEKHHVWQERVHQYIGSSTDPAIVESIRKEVAGKRVLVTFDSDHRREHVLRELAMYSPMVPVGSYVVVQDTASNGHPVPTDFGPGPWEAVQEFLQTHPEFVQDHSREKYLLTFYPGGFLKRVR